MPLKIPFNKGGKEGEGEILRRFHAVAKPSGGCPVGLGKPNRQPPVAARPLSLRAAPFVKGEYSFNVAPRSGMKNSVVSNGGGLEDCPAPVPASA